MKKLFFNILVSFTVVCFAQAQQVSGTITEAETGAPLPGATVLVKGTNNGTTTDFDGVFQLSNVSGTATLVVSYIGFKTQEIAVNNATELSIALTAEANVLDEIVMIGYGTQRKKEVTGAVSVLDAKSIEKLNPVRTEQALQGQIAGVNITSQSGSPGSGFNIRIRGITTNRNNNPLILVDGNRIGDLNALNPNDIASINVLKDATAGIYGVQAANGVILITTKSGRKNSELDVQLDSYTGFQLTSKKLDLMDAFDFAQYVNDASNKTEFFVYPQNGTDWQDEVFEQAAMSELNLTVSGGGEKSAYSVGASYLNQDGIVGGNNNNYRRITTRLNYQYDILDNLKLTANALYFNSEKQNLPEGGNGSVLFSAINLNPDMPVYDENGDFALADGISQREVMNPVALIHNAYNTTRINKWTAVGALEYNFWDNFTVKSQFSINHANVLDDDFKPELYYGGSKQSNYPATIKASELMDDKIQNEVMDFGVNYDDWTLDNYITYTNTFNDVHNLTVLLGTSLFKTRGQYYGATGRTDSGTNQLGQTIFDAGMEREPRFNAAELENGDDWFENRLSSIFTRVQYSYKGKYLFSGVFRRDVSSYFSSEENRNVGYFPSGSLGWNVSEEEFMQNVRWISNLKLRASYGIIGNDRIDGFSYLTRLNGNSGYATGASSTIFGKSSGKLGNPLIKWEEQETANLGVDFSLFDSRLSVSVDAYQKQTKDLLLEPQVSGSTGASAPGSGSPFVNAGTVRNRGIEFSIGYRDTVGDDFSYNLNYNFNAIDNEVISLNERTPPTAGEFGIGISQTGISRMIPGLPLGHYYGYKTDGVYQTQAEIDALNAAAVAAHGEGETYSTIGGDIAPGDLRFVDMNGDGQITAADRTNIGDPIAEFEMGFSFGFTYKNLDFSANAFASLGHDLIRGYEMNNPFANKGNYVLDRWQGSGTSNSIPRPEPASINNNFFSDYHVEDASYVRLQNVQLGYNFTSLLGEDSGIDNLRLYLSGNNIITISDYSGYDPSANTGAPLGGTIDKGFYPVAATYMVGINLNF